MRLYQQRDKLQAKMKEIEEWKKYMDWYIQSSKFQGQGNDYMNISELARHLANLQEILWK
jgi:hypothetical protein